MVAVSGVYEIRNTENGKRYVGSSVDVMKRFRTHSYRLRESVHHSPHLQSAWNKYGDKSFVFNLLVICEPLELLRYEQGLIDSLRPEYNVSPSAYSGLGRKTSPETRIKLSNALKGIKRGPFTEEHRAKLSAARMGRTLSTEHRGNIGRSLVGNTNSVGKYHSREVRAKISEANIGRVFSPEHCANISEAKSGKSRKPFSTEHRKKLGDASRGKKRSPETCEKISKSKTGKTQKPLSVEHRKKIGDTLRGRSRSPETRAKISATKLAKRNNDGSQLRSGV